MNASELKSRIAAIDYLLEQINQGNSLEALRQSQTERRAELAERLRLLTTCHCGKGMHIEVRDKQYINCYCNGKLVTP